MFGWIPATFSLVKRNFGAMSVASLLNLCVVLVMLLPMFYVMYRAIGSGAMADPTNPFGADMGMILGMYGVLVVVGLLLMPPLMAGWFRLCENADRGAAIAGTDIFRPYSDVPLWLRLIGFVLLIFVLYMLVFAVLGVAFSGAIAGMMKMQAAQNAAIFSGQPAPPPSMAALSGILLLYVVAMPLMFLLQFVYLVGLAEVSLRATPVLAAFKDALATVLRNALKLLVFMFVIGIVGLVVGFLLALIVGVIVAALAMISPALMVVAMLLLYIPMLLVMYPLMFSFNYAAWKSMLGSEPPSPPVDSIVAA